MVNGKAADIFTEWLKKTDKKKKQQNCKLLLLMHQCITHHQETELLENLKIGFFHQIAPVNYNS